MDWTKLLFQVFNLAIMVFILYRVLLKSTLRALDERSRRVTSALDMAEQHEHEADAAYARFQERLAQMQEKTASLKQEAQEELWRTQRHVLRETRHEIEAIRANAARDVTRTYHEGVYDYQCDLGSLVTALGERLIREAGGDAFQKACISKFLAQLSALPAGEFRSAHPTEREQKAQVRIISAFALDAADAAQIRQLAEELVGGPVNVIGKVDPALVAGIMMYIGDRVLDGSVAGALHRLLERYVADLPSSARMRSQHRTALLPA